MEALPVFLDRIVNRVLAVVISVTLILAFGEVIPQALCTGPNQVKIAAYLAPLTRFLMIISWPLSFWIGKALDIILGEHHKTRYLNSDLKALVELHTYKALKELAEEEEKHQYIPKEDIARPSDKMGLNEVESKLMLGALALREAKAREIIIPFHKVFKVNYEEKIDMSKLKMILDKGYSRIPVYQNNNENDVIGILRIKKLITIDVTQNKSLKELKFYLKPPLVVHPDIKIDDLFNEFVKGKSHMAFVTEQVEKLQTKLGLNRTNSIAVENNYLYNKKGDLGILILGIVTLEDILNYMFKMNILDEDDYEKQKGKLGSNVRSESKLEMMMKDRQAAGNFIKNQCDSISNLIRENKRKPRNEKEEFLELKDTGKGGYGGINEKLI
ncbi:MAG: CNNM domain-containing protein [archaeon]|nr:CNNM domain-containing protein [archaeon]